MIIPVRNGNFSNTVFRQQLRLNNMLRTKLFPKTRRLRCQLYNSGPCNNQFIAVKTVNWFHLHFTSTLFQSFSYTLTIQNFFLKSYHSCNVSQDENVN
mmetsp:Transcript_26728/g.39560  ORF Transcript_26728/g.39560 Transcript_26728/m.39560 type:complete len:98 (-) Transcript_26728:679-972(-)